MLINAALNFFLKERQRRGHDAGQTDLAVPEGLYRHDEAAVYPVGPAGVRSDAVLIGFCAGGGHPQPDFGSC